MRLAASALILVLFASANAASAAADGEMQQLVTKHVQRLLPENRAGGVAVAVRIKGRTLFFNYGLASLANNRPITPDLLFNLASLGKIFDTALLAQAITQGEIKFDDPASKYVPELEQGGDIRRVT